MTNGRVTSSAKLLPAVILLAAGLATRTAGQAPAPAHRPERPGPATDAAEIEGRPYAPEAVGRLRELGWRLHHDHVLGLQRVTVVNMIPNAQSDETEQDSEPNLAVDPTDPRRIVGTAFTPNPSGSVTEAPIFVSEDGGNTWDLNNIVPSGNGMTGDISVDFPVRGQTLYAGILRGGSGHRQVTLRAPDPFTATMMTVLTDHSTDTYDQPYVSSTTFDDAGTDRDRVYLGFNNLGDHTAYGGTGRTASGEYSLDARTAAPPSGFMTTRLEARSTNGQDMPAVRFAVHPSGVIYGLFYRFTSGTASPLQCDVIVVRDDAFASGAASFTALTDPSDGVAGRIVESGRSVPTSPTLGQNRLVASNLSVAVDPRQSSSVWIAWADRVGTADYTLHVRHSSDSGATWSGDLLTVTDAMNPALAVTSSGQVGFLYQQLTGTAPGQRWQTHFRRTMTGATWGDLLLADTPSDVPARVFHPYIGDYVDLVAVGRSFYGIFSASNAPDLVNFPHGVTYQRNADFTARRLRNVANTADVAVSIDPFFFSVTPPFLVDICKLLPQVCRIIDLEPGRIVIHPGEVPVRVVDPIPDNCRLKWGCPGCGGGNVLCPPYYHVILEDLDPREWRVGLTDRLGTPVRHEVNRLGADLVVSFRPPRALFEEGRIGDMVLTFESTREHSPGGREIRTRLETSDFPFAEHVERRKGSR